MQDKRILVVEDDLFLRDIYSETLKHTSYMADFAKDGREALEKIKQGGWDLILLDVLLPGMTGIEVMKSLQDVILPKPNKKIVFMTNTDNSKEMAEMSELGLEYWTKSELTPDKFLKKIEPYLN